MIENVLDKVAFLGDFLIKQRTIIKPVKIFVTYYACNDEKPSKYHVKGGIYPYLVNVVIRVLFNVGIDNGDKL